jgi:hypothetical protein
MPESIVIDSPSIAISSETISLRPAAMGLPIVVFFHAQGKDDSTPTDSSFEYDVESERKLSAKNKKMGLFGIGLYSKDQSRWSRKDRVFLVIPWSS